MESLVADMSMQQWDNIFQCTSSDDKVNIFLNIAISLFEKKHVPFQRVCEKPVRKFCLDRDIAL